jgi:hypothetical protein
VPSSALASTESKIFALNGRCGQAEFPDIDFHFAQTSQYAQPGAPRQHYVEKNHIVGFNEKSGHSL